jgi:hypothetical protein
MSAPGLKPRPALVVDVGLLRDQPAVEVAYGTSQKVDRVCRGEFAVTPEDGDAFAASGLSYPAKFDVAHCIFLPYDDDWLAIAPEAPFGQTPKLGVLHPSLVGRAKAAYDALR